MVLRAHDNALFIGNEQEYPMNRSRAEQRQKNVQTTSYVSEERISLNILRNLIYRDDRLTQAIDKLDDSGYFSENQSRL